MRCARGSKPTVGRTRPQPAGVPHAQCSSNRTPPSHGPTLCALLSCSAGGVASANTSIPTQQPCENDAGGPLVLNLANKNNPLTGAHTLCAWG